MAGDSALVKELRQKTGAGIMDCKQALVESGDDINKAIDWLRQKGLAAAGKKAGRATNDGVIASYIHPGSKVGVLIEVNCETDFVARNEKFKNFAHEVALHIAFASPSYVDVADIPADVVEEQRKEFTKEAKATGKPDNVVDKIVEGKLEKFFSEQCLLEQPFIKDATGKTKVKDLVDTVNAKTQERVVVKRFARFQVGER